ncbi:DUF4809 family protein [Enterococcus caccae]|uniref:DUF4809 domain-containing protein n=1 Tax=Enterococcus caccae ATCC BAA-1240 TaxID=1158612 RepID=R3TP77_9ENTE|nr:DUF4809 family protein [Enterococcus caccae]EOL42858.1 hypothetical protein UC7_03266 [Enterococcus caccae ATCC BAA-1240]EOT67664.1 hypothetical protein I580_00046 [Enterococcus caccae ATCC BAA-1240]
MMKKALITKTVNLLDGGCNVCGIIEDENYVLTIGEQTIPLEELTVNALITGIVLKNGYKRKYVSDVIDDYTLYIKEEYQVILKEEYNFLTYSNDTEKIETQDQIVDEKKLAEKVNELLVTLFKVEELVFCF